MRVGGAAHQRGQLVHAALDRLSLGAELFRGRGALLGSGVELSQIRFAYNPRADYANVALVHEDMSVRIEWESFGGDSSGALATDSDTLAGIVKRLASQQS